MKLRTLCYDCFKEKIHPDPLYSDNKMYQRGKYTGDATLVCSNCARDIGFFFKIKMNHEIQSRTETDGDISKQTEEIK